MMVMSSTFVVDETILKAELFKLLGGTKPKSNLCQKWATLPIVSTMLSGRCASPL